MIVISNLSQSYVQEVAAAEMSAIIGGGGKKDYCGKKWCCGGYYSSKDADVDIEQYNVFSDDSYNDADVRIDQ